MHRRPPLPAISLVVVLVLATAILGTGIFIETQFHPSGSAFGVPSRILLCGRSFTHGSDDARIWTRAEVYASMDPGHSPIVLEPTIGKIPLLAIFESHPWVPPAKTCDVLIFLHVGPDQYVAYGLEGGP